MLDLNLKQRGILLVAFPLSCQLLFVAFLFFVLWQLQNQIMRESHARDVMGSSQSVLMSVMETVAYGYLDDDRHAVSGRSELNKKVDAVQIQIDKLLDMVKADGREETVAEIKSTSDKLLSLFRWSEEHRPFTRSGKSDRKRILAAGLISNLQQFIKALTKLSQFDESGKGSVALIEYEFTLKLLFVSVVVASTGIAVLLGVFYVKSIRKPVSHITENSRRLSAREPLLPELANQDELGTLDRLFHQVSAVIDEAVTGDRAMMENAADLICSLDRQGLFTQVNSYALTMLGCEPEEMIGRSVFDFTIEEDLLVVEQHLSDPDSSGSSRQFEIRVKKQDGTILDTRWSCFWSVSEGSLFCVVHDITEERGIERLRQDMLDMISHDLRSPLTAMLASMSMLAAGARGPLTESVQQDLGVAVHHIENLIAFVNDLLDYQKLLSGRLQLQLEIHNLEEIMSSAMETIAGVIEAKQVEIVSSAGDWQLTCDKQKVSQALSNALQYAIAQSTAADTIYVYVEENRFSLSLVIEFSPLAELSEEAFEELTSLSRFHKPEEGTGLELAIGKLIIEAHGGAIGMRMGWEGSESFVRPRITDSVASLWFSVPKSEEVA